MFDTPWIAALAALFLWWFATGILLWRVHVADRGGPDSHVWSVILSLPLFAGGVLGVNATLADPSPQGAWFAFLSALAIWGWVELAFLSGIITGPERRPCPETMTGFARFARAWDTISRHELLLVAALLAVAMIAAHAENTVGFWTYVILFVARISAKLNLFFGVPRINTEFVPRPLAHLTSYFRRGPITAMFPLAITILSFGMACFLQRLWVAETDPAIVAATLLTTLSGLALLEHWLMVVPLPDAKLWRWMLPAPADMTSEERKTNGL
jgi:putative photosynthetic complex assembly protein 2